MVRTEIDTDRQLFPVDDASIPPVQLLATLTAVVAAVVAYRTSPESHWWAAAAGGGIGICLGASVAALVCPRAFLQEMRRRGNDPKDRAIPLVATFTLVAIFLIAEPVLGRPDIWAPVVIIASLVGMAAAGRLLSVIVYDD
ncbi:hypothetical protein [Maioricimonas rarisocia]|nr:hypothetical protein [Maioricimonas rarisocia]